MRNATSSAFSGSCTSLCHATIFADNSGPTRRLFSHIKYRLPAVYVSCLGTRIHLMKSKPLTKSINHRDAAHSIIHRYSADHSLKSNKKRPRAYTPSTPGKKRARQNLRGIKQEMLQTLESRQIARILPARWRVFLILLGENCNHGSYLMTCHPGMKRKMKERCHTVMPRIKRQNASCLARDLTQSLNLTENQKPTLRVKV